MDPGLRFSPAARRPAATGEQGSASRRGGQGAAVAARAMGLQLRRSVSAAGRLAGALAERALWLSEPSEDPFYPWLGRELAAPGQEIPGRAGHSGPEGSLAPPASRESTHAGCPLLPKSPRGE